MFKGASFLSNCLLRLKNSISKSPAVKVHPSVQCPSMLTQLISFATIGVGAQKVLVEIGAPPGDGKMFIVGLGDTAVKESEWRVRMALRTSGHRFPTGRRITVNLAPASFRKAGPRYDLTIAVGLLIISGALEIEDNRLKEMAFLGELALDGSVRHVTGVLPAAVACRDMGIRTIVVPVMDVAEAALIPGIEVIGVSHLTEIVSILAGEMDYPPVRPMKVGKPIEVHYADFADVRGQQAAKRALEIAAGGGNRRDTDLFRRQSPPRRLSANRRPTFSCRTPHGECCLHCRWRSDAGTGGNQPGTSRA